MIKHHATFERSPGAGASTGRRLDLVEPSPMACPDPRRPRRASSRSVVVIAASLTAFGLTTMAGEGPTEASVQAPDPSESVRGRLVCAPEDPGCGVEEILLVVSSNAPGCTVRFADADAQGVFTLPQPCGRDATVRPKSGCVAWTRADDASTGEIVLQVARLACGAAPPRSRPPDSLDLADWGLSSDALAGVALWMPDGLGTRMVAVHLAAADGPVRTTVGRAAAGAGQPGFVGSVEEVRHLDPGKPLSAKRFLAAHAALASAPARICTDRCRGAPAAPEEIVLLVWGGGHERMLVRSVEAASVPEVLGSADVLRLIEDL